MIFLHVERDTDYLQQTSIIPSQPFLRCLYTNIKSIFLSNLLNSKPRRQSTFPVRVFSGLQSILKQVLCGCFWNWAILPKTPEIKRSDFCWIWAAAVSKTMIYMI